jgi:hypothetical protein
MEGKMGRQQWSSPWIGFAQGSFNKFRLWTLGPNKKFSSRNSGLNDCEFKCECEWLNGTLTYHTYQINYGLCWPSIIWAIWRKCQILFYSKGNFFYRRITELWPKIEGIAVKDILAFFKPKEWVKKVNCSKCPNSKKKDIWQNLKKNEIEIKKSCFTSKNMCKRWSFCSSKR